MKIPNMENEIKRIIRLYTVRGFNIKYILVDIQFKAIKDRGNLEAIVNVAAMERLIRVIKEQCRCYYAVLLFDDLPRMMVIHLLVIPG
jgi:acetolactate synthase regulatory subunit